MNMCPEGEELKGCSEKGNKFTILNTAANVGISIGSLIGGKVMQYSRIKLIMFANFLGVGFSLMCTIEDFWVISAGRLGFGFAAGLAIATAPVFLGETIPAHVLDKGFGSSTNISISIGVMTMTLFGIGNPDPDDLGQLSDSSMWRFIYGFPVVTCGISLLMCIFYLREDSLIYYL